jgi:hypothetical protein
VGPGGLAGDPKNTYFGSYREVFARDLYEAWTAVFLDGDRRTASDMTRFLFERQQQPDGSMPRNSLPNGKLAPDSFNTQLDECAYPLIMALAVGLTDNAYYKAHIAPAANFVASHGPSFGPSAGRSRAASRRRRSRPRSRASSRPRSSPTATATTLGARVARPRPTSSSATSRSGR